ncbi:hypothetical protein BDR06DRAFT_979904 [Suillus hirtellus]|nr:hypothetical protein BDR06DRAFT_979904 [Suillus hirtellus]
MVANGLSRKWEGIPPTTGDGSEWMVSEDWEARTRLANDVMLEPVFLEVINAIHNLDQDKNIQEKKRARHRALQYIIEDEKLWRLKGGTETRARAKVECISKEEVKILAEKVHTGGGHWGRDAVKMTLMD